MQRFSDINLVRQELKGHMELDQFISLADKRYMAETGKKCDPLERINDHLYKKRCDLDEHPVDPDGTRDSTASFTVCPPKELWHCFGCGSSGDRFEYISRKFHVDHMDSIRICAEIESFDLSPYYEDVSAEEQINNQRNYLRDEEIENIDSGKKNYQTSVYYMDIVNELEKMGDFMINISQAAKSKHEN